MCRHRSLFVLLAVALLLVPIGAGAITYLHVGPALSDIRLPVPQNPDEREYLGLSGGESFTLDKVKSEVVLIEVLSTYCTFCQAVAPRVNTLRMAIDRDPKLSSAMKIIGIAAGNSPVELNAFKKEYNPAFPVFADEDFALYASFNEARAPYFVLVRVNDGSRRVLYTHLGAFQDAEVFLEELRQAAGLNAAGKNLAREETPRATSCDIRAEIAQRKCGG